MDALDAAVTLHPAIYVQPKDRGPASEDDRQTVVVATLRRTCKAVRVFAVPNGGKRTQWAARKAKREGMSKGWPDLGIVYADGIAWVEMKAARTMPDDDQVETLNWLHARGHHVAVCRDVEGVISWLASIGAPVRPLR